MAPLLREGAAGGAMGPFGILALRLLRVFSRLALLVGNGNVVEAALVFPIF